MKIIVTIVPTNLVKNSLLFFFCPLVETKKKNETSSKLVVWQQEVPPLFDCREPWSTPQVCQIY